MQRMFYLRQLSATAAALILALAPAMADGTGATAPPAAADEWITGVAHSTPIPPAGAGDVKIAAAVKFYDYPIADFHWRMKKKGSDDHVVTYEIEIDSAVVTDVAENNRITGFFYEPLDPVTVKRAGAVVLHHLGGEMTAEEMLGKTLAENGIASVFMYFPYYQKRWNGKGSAPGILTEDMSHSLPACRQAVLDIHRCGDWLAQRPDVDPARLGITGISLGAIIGSLAGGVDPSFAKLALVLAGGNMAEIVLRQLGEEKLAARLKEQGATLEQLREALIPIEPLTFAHRVNPNNVLMLNATDDEIIPKDCTKMLWKEFGKPKIKWYKGGHYSAGLYLTDIVKEVATHLGSPVLPRTPPGTTERGND